MFYFHGTPGSRYEAGFSDQAGREYGYRIIALDRPGVGHSDYVSGRRLLDWPEDVREVAEQLGIDRFGLIGVSGGGPYVLACCHAIPDRLDFSVLMGSWGPVAEEPTLWRDVARLDRFFGRLSRGAPWAFYAPFSLLGYAARKLSPQRFASSLGSSMSEADKALLRDDAMSRFFSEDVTEGFRQGVRGPADDAIILYSDWGFRVDVIEAEVNLHHGREDKFAPFSHAKYLHEHLPRSTLHAYPGEGHLFVMKLFGTLFEQLSPRSDED